MIAALATAMIMRDLLAVEGTTLDAAVLVRSEASETLVDDLRVLAMEVGVHLDIAGAHIDLGTVLVDAVVVGLLPVVGAALAIGGCTVVAGGETCEAELEALLALLVPLQVTNDVILLAQDLALAGLIVAMEVLTQRLLATQRVLALQIRGYLAQMLQVLLVLQEGVQAARRRQADQALGLITGRGRS